MRSAVERTRQTLPQNNNNKNNKNKLVTNYRTTGKKQKSTSREEVEVEAEKEEEGGKNQRGLDAKLICAFIKFSGFFHRVVQGRSSRRGPSESGLWP